MTDVQGLTEEYVSCRPALVRYLIRILRSPSDAEDIAQDTYVRLVGCTPSSEIVSPRAFIFQIARNLSVDHLRRRRQKETSILYWSNEFQEGLEAGPDEWLVADEQLAILLKAILSLPPQCQRVYTLRKIYSLSQREIAKRLGISVRTVENHVAKAAKDCSQFLRDHSARALRNSETTSEGSSKEGSRGR